jgi:hypothetical protein
MNPGLTITASNPRSTSASTARSAEWGFFVGRLFQRPDPHGVATGNVDEPGAFRPGGLGHAPGAADVDPAVAIQVAAADLDVAGRVDHAGRSRARAAHGVRVADIAPHHLDVEPLQGARIGGLASQHADRLTAIQQHPQHVVADQPRGAGDQSKRWFHGGGLSLA